MDGIVPEDSELAGPPTGPKKWGGQTLMRS